MPRIGRSRILRRNQTVVSHLYVVLPIARGIHFMRPQSFELDDLVQIGNLALIYAAESFDEDCGIPFTAYARKRVRWAILDATRRRAYRDATHQRLQQRYL